MNVKTELVREFAEVVNSASGKGRNSPDNIVYGTLKKDGAYNYVQIDGSDLLTPVTVAASADAGDRMAVIIKNHSAIAGFNLSSPSVNTRTMDNLVSTVNGNFDRIDATYITAEKANLNFATIQSLEVVNGKFDALDAKYLSVENAKITYATIESLTVTNVKVETITGDFASFKTGEFENLKAKKADIDLANVVNAWIQNGIIKDGSIGAAAIHDGAITNVKIADATIEAAKIKSINADVITAGTLKTDRLIITGEDGEDSIVKVINIVNGVPEAEVNNTKIQAASVDVADLSAFKAKIALFDLSGNAIYNGKTSIKDPASGIYISTTGIGIGDGGLTGKEESPIQMYADGTFKLIGKNSSLDFNTVTGMLDMEVSSLKVASKTVAIKDDLDSVTDRVTQAEAKITQNTDSINLRVEKNGIVSAINQSSETVTIDASKINLNGYVTISSLSGSGTSTIDGSNIKTGKISTDRLDVTEIFSKDVTATGTITGANLVGGRFSCTGERGTMELANDKLLAQYDYTLTNGQKFSDHVTFNSSFIHFSRVKYSGNTASEETTLYMSHEELALKDVASFYKSGITFEPAVTINKDLQVNGGMSTAGNGTFGGDLSATRGLKLNHGGTSLYLYNESGNFCMMHTGTDGSNTWPIIWDFKNDNLAIANSINCGAYGTFGKGIISKSESVFHTGSYTDPYPGKTCTIKSWGTVASLRFVAKGVGNSWLGAAKSDGAAYDTICTDADALVPGWRVRSADGAWVGASYAHNPGFIIYYCNASRLAGSTNGTDAMYTFGTSGTFYAKSVSQTSDEREKNILSGITEKYENLFMQLKPVLFSWKSGTDGVHMGFGAQTTLKTAERCGISASELAAVHKNETEEPWSMSYTEIVPLAVQMTQKIIKKTNEQDQKIKILESHIQMLQTALDQAFVKIAKLKKAVG